MTYAATHQLQNLWDKIWKDNQGNVVIWQNPNIPLAIWVGFTVLSLFTGGHFSSVLSLIASIALVIWSALEIVKGVNYFRRALGILVGVVSILSLINNITHF